VAAQKIRSDMILRHLQKRHIEKARMDDVFLTEVKNGQSYVPRGELLILDALAIKKSWANPCFTGYEVKVDRGDFMRDQKWPGYMQYCHQFYFACPQGLIQPDELPKEVGLIYYNPDKDCITTKRKALYRPIEISSEMLMYIVMSKLDSDRHPFFSNRREMLQAIIEDKEDRKELGRYVARKTAELISDLETDKRQFERTKKDSEQLKEIIKVLRVHGINTYWNIAESLEKVLGTNMDPGIIQRVERMGELAAEINHLLQAK
jgi:hypothetical protein